VCHHWIGIVFLPRVTLDRTAALMQAYDDYREIYRLFVRRSQMLSRDGDRFMVSLQLFMKKVDSVVLNTEDDVSFVRVSPTRTRVRSQPPQLVVDERHQRRQCLLVALTSAVHERSDP
jgi:hypothetical protein